MIAKITLRQTFTVEIDGQPVIGAYTIEGDWEGMIKLKCDGPVGSLIIHPPAKRVQVHDLVPKMLGGNAKNGEPISFEAEVVRADCGHVGVGATKEFKRPK